RGPGARERRACRVSHAQGATRGGCRRGGHAAHRGEKPGRIGAAHPRGAPAARDRGARGRPPARRSRQALATRGAVVPRRTAVPECGSDRLRRRLVEVLEVVEAVAAEGYAERANGPAWQAVRGMVLRT